MTETGSDLEPFGITVLCDKPDCVAMYAKYSSVYDKYLKQHQDYKTLKDQNTLLSFDFRHKLSLLETQQKHLKHIIDKEKAATDAMQNMATSEGMTAWGASTCSGCVHHRNALIAYRTYTSKNCDSIMDLQTEEKRILDSAREDLKVALMANAKLKVQSMKCNDPFWKDREVQSLKEEVSKYKSLAEKADQTIVQLKREKEEGAVRLAICKQRAESLETELIRMRMNDRPDFGHVSHAESPRPKRKLEECEVKLEKPSEEDCAESKKTPIANLAFSDPLTQKLLSVFSVAEDGEGNPTTEETALYDVFVASVPPDEREAYFEAMYTACHPGERFSQRDRKLLKEGVVRVCKTSFAACLAAIGGECKKRGTQNVWTNILVN